MKTTIVEGNGNGETTGVRFASNVIEENPYLQRKRDRGQQGRAMEEKEPFGQSIDDDEGSPIELEDEQRKVKRRRRRFALAGIATLLLLAFFAAVTLYHRTATRVDYGKPRSQRETTTPSANSTTGRDSRTQQAIEEAQRLTVTGQENREKKNDEPTVNSTTIRDSPFTTPTGFSGTFNTASAETPINAETTLGIKGASAATPSPAAPESDSRSNRSQRNSESSLYMNESAVQQRIDVSSRSTTQTFGLKSNAAVILPTFASMLPVRTIGALYTLRTGALARFELTRDTKGDGWSMKRGTILVGTTKGSDYDRAYVSIIGFIDPQSGKLVNLSGDVRGGDGAAGLKGNRKQLDGGWMRALGVLTSTALDVTGALISGRGQDTVVITDGLRSRTINPVTDEISGVIGNELDRRQSRSFVEVVAGAPGYVMVTDLPSTIKGIEAAPELNSETLASLTDVDAKRQTTGLSERELAELLTTGSLEQIRAAMPRMSVEMRRIAAAVISNNEQK